MALKNLLGFLAFSLLCDTAVGQRLGPATLKPELFPIYEHGKVGYINQKGEKVIAPRLDFGRSYHGDFTEQEFFHEDKAVAAICKGENRSCKFGFIDRNGQFVIQPVFDNALAFSEGLAPVKLGDNWGFINYLGKMAVPARFLDAYPFQEGFATVILRGGGQKMINRAGRFLKMPPGVKEFGVFHEGLLAVKIRGKWGFINKQGKLAIPPRFEPYLNDHREDEYSGEFHMGLAIVRLKGKWGYIDRTGKLVIPAKYITSMPFQANGVAVVALAYYDWRIINRSGAFVSRRSFEGIYPFSEGLAAFEITYREGLAGVIVDNKWGFVDRKGRLLIPATFDQVSPFSYGLAAARVAGKWGYIDYSGKFVIEPQFVSESHFRGALARHDIREVSQTSGPGTVPKWGYIDRTGKFVWKSAD